MNTKKVIGYTLYKGIVITQRNDGFYALLRRFDTIDEARKIVEFAISLG
jgi:hypothetical protein